MIFFLWTLGIFDYVNRIIETLILDIYHPVSSRDLKASDANGFVQKAISAANVYNNIMKYVNDANITSVTTLNLSQRAEDVCYTIVLHSMNQLSFNRDPELGFTICAVCFRPSLGSTHSSNTW